MGKVVGMGAEPKKTTAEKKVESALKKANKELIEKVEALEAENKELAAKVAELDTAAKADEK